MIRSNLTPPPGGAKKLRVVITDDSMFMRAAIAKTLGASGQFEVVGQARDGHDALDKVLALAPDVVTMDFNMPGWTGADTVREIMAKKPTPVVMFSAHTKAGARETFEALAAGAVDFVAKPGGEVSTDLAKIADELVRKLIAAASARPRVPTAPIRRPTTGPIGFTGTTTLTPGLPRLCVIAVSTGGPAALSRLVPALPGDIRFGVIIVQHMPAHFTAALAERLDADSALTVREAQAGDRPMPGLCLIAPGDRHVEFDDRGLITLHDGPLVNGCRPAADVTMLSAARVYGRRTIGVVMTGMGKDGAAGVRAIKQAEGKTLAQDQDSSVIFGMPKAAIETGAIDDVAPLDELAARLRAL
ncbi:MAG: chemotaxis response regulator protein-glutamate methylesterase [Deltaproteobacteria bacterium]|nr:chemotaxis response regulator protein-glutamate methylesterase [Deltaproteobacteria bacterium]